MQRIKENALSILITIITIILGIGAVYASLQLRKLASTKTEPTKSAEAQEVCRTMFTLKFKPTPSIVEIIPTIATNSAFPTESTPPAIPAEELDFITPMATATPTTLLDFEISPTKVRSIN